MVRPSLLIAVRGTFVSLLGALVLGGCSCEDTIGGLRAKVEVEPASLDFGLVAVGATGERTVQVKNRGSLTLDLTGYDIDPPFIAPAKTTTIGTGQAVTLTVGFKPPAVGPSTGTLTIHTSDPDAPEVTVDLSGAGIEAAVKVEPQEIDFGEVLWTVETLPLMREVTVSNPGSDNFDVTAIELVEDGAGALTVDLGTAKKTYAPRASGKLTVTYTPNAMGAITGRLRIATTAKAAPEVIVPIRARAVGPRMEVCARGPNVPELCTEANEVPKVDFGYIPLNSTGQGLIRVMNKGDRDMIIRRAFVSGAADEFSFAPAIDMMSEITVMPSAEVRWDVSFLPVNYVYDSFVVSFSSNSATRRLGSVRVEGKVPRARINVAPRGVTFQHSGAVPRGQTPVRIYNCGEEALTIRSDVVVRQTMGPTMAISLLNAPTAGEMIPPQPMCDQGPPGKEMTVVFETMTSGNYAAEIDVVSNDPVDPSVRVSVIATKN